MTRAPAPAPEQFGQQLRRLGRSERTVHVYRQWVERFLRFRREVLAKEGGIPGLTEAKEFLRHLAEERRLSKSSCYQARAALVSFFEQVLDIESAAPELPLFPSQAVSPSVLEPEEVERIFAHFPPGQPRLVVRLIYSSGLRPSEAVRLRVRDLDFEQQCLRIRSSQRFFQCTALVPGDLERDLRKQVEQVEEWHHRADQLGIAGVGLPPEVESECPQAALELDWQYLFPIDLRLARGRPRRHIYLQTLDRAFAKARRAAGIELPVTLSSLRYSGARRLLRTGMTHDGVLETLGCSDDSKILDCCGRVISARSPLATSVASAGFAGPDPDPERVLVELSRAQARTWETIGTRVSRLPETSEPVFQAIRDWMQARDPEQAPALKGGSTPAYCSWLGRAPAVPLGFARLVIEAARKRAAREPEQAVELSKRAFDRLEGAAALGEIDARAHQQLIGLAAAYHADGQRAHSRHLEAESWIARARTFLGPEPEPEIRVSFLQVEAELLRDFGRCSEASRNLDQAATLALELEAMPGRWAEIRLQQARLELHEARPVEAERLLLEALEEAPEDFALYLRLEILHCLAASTLSQRRFRDTDRYLELASELEAYADAEILGQRHWMAGCSILKREGWPPSESAALEAHEHLDTSFTLLSSAGQWTDAAAALSTLLEASAWAGCLEATTGKHEAEISILFRAGRLEGMIRKSLRALGDRFDEQDLDSSAIREFLARRERGDVETPS